MLECPIYSIFEWNKSRGHPDTDAFKDQDKLLEDKIRTLNEHTREQNNYVVPQFSWAYWKTQNKQERTL